jgi:uncharacterized membrane protein
LYFKALLLIHIAGAIIGFGPTFTFAILGPMAGQRPGPGGFALMEGISAIAKRLVVPVAALTQPVSGVLLILEAGWSRDFFSHEWLWIAIAIFAVMFYLAVLVNRPSIDKMIRLAKEGKADSPEFVAAAKLNKTLGPITTVMVLVIMFLMIWKPGG